MTRKVNSPFEQDTWKRIQEDSAFAEVFFEELLKRPLAVQVSILRKMRGISQVELATRLHITQSYLSKLEREDSDHLVGIYEKLAKLLQGRLAIVPLGTKIVPNKRLFKFRPAA